MANVSIKYKDSQDWTRVDGLIVDWSALAQVYKDERVEAAYLPPEIVTDIWNGKIHDVQHIRWDAWQLEFIGKESELQALSRMQSCDTVLIYDIDNGLSHTVDMQTSEWFNFGEPERVGMTTSYKLVLIYRTNKTIINKFEGLSNQVTLIGNSTYYSKYIKLNLPTVSEQINVDWFDGSQRLLRELDKDGVKVLLYMSDANMQTFKADYNQNSLTIDGTTVIEKLPLEINQLGEDNYQIIVSVITVVNKDTKDLSPLNTHDLDIDSGTHFYTDYPVIQSYQDTELSQFNNEDGVPITSKAITRKVTLVKLFLDESDTYSLKQLFEKSTDIEIDAVTVLSNRIVSVTQLAYDLYEINVECLVTATITNPL